MKKYIMSMVILSIVGMLHAADVPDRFQTPSGTYGNPTNVLKSQKRKRTEVSKSEQQRKRAAFAARVQENKQRLDTYDKIESDYLGQTDVDNMTTPQFIGVCKALEADRKALGTRAPKRVCRGLAVEIQEGALVDDLEEEFVEALNITGGSARSDVRQALTGKLNIYESDSDNDVGPSWLKD